MFDDLLFPTDGSDGAEAAFDHALDIATTHDATVHVLSVAETAYGGLAGIDGDVVDMVEQKAEDIVHTTADHAQERGVATVTEVVNGEPYREIVDYANATDADLIVMPTHGRRGIERFLLGSVTERVVRRADVPVLTLHPGEDSRNEHPYRNVLVPTDGSSCAEHALATGIDVARAENANLHVLSVVETAALGTNIRSEMQIDSLEGRAERVVTRAADAATDAGIATPTTAVEYGSSIAGTIRGYVDDHDIDLVVVGTHGRTGFDRYVLGSVTEQLVRTAGVPVLSVRGPVAEES